jgi:glutathione S-transferase
MILAGQYDSPYVRRVAVALHLIGVPFTRDNRSVFADADEMRRINPLGRVPSLVLDDGEVLVDSWAILDYLEEIAPTHRALLPISGVARRRALRLSAIACGAMDKAVSGYYERTLRPPERVFGAWIDRCELQVASALAALEAETPDDGWYLGGRRPMQPDVTVGCLLGFLRLRAAHLAPDGRYPRLDAHAAACEALPEFAQTPTNADERAPDGPR